MNREPGHISPLGDFKPSDHWQTHINEIFYGLLGPKIHHHFQTFVSLDYRLAHALADDYFNCVKDESPDGRARFIQEWGVGNGNLAACFLTRLKEIDAGEKVYPNVHYVLCDYSEEILRGARANPRLQAHAGHFSTVRIDAENLGCFQPRSLDKIVSNEIWDDLGAKALLKHQGSLYEEYLQPCLDPSAVAIDWETFKTQFAQKDLGRLAERPPFMADIVWQRDYQRVDIGDWPHAEVLARHVDGMADEIPFPVNTGAFTTLERARELLRPDGQGYSGFDYGMFSMDDLNWEGRPYFNLYGGQYTFMVNFELLAAVGKALGFADSRKEYQSGYVGRSLGEKVVSLVDIVKNHPRAPQLAPWDRDLLMLNTLHAINRVYRSPYAHKMDYPPMEGTPKKQRKQINQLAKNLSNRGVPDTVAYVTEGEVRKVLNPLVRLGYREKDILRAFNAPPEPVSFIAIHFK